MKTITLFIVSLTLMACLSGCASNKAEKEAYHEDGKMDEQVESWKGIGGRY